MRGLPGQIEAFSRQSGLADLLNPRQRLAPAVARGVQIVGDQVVRRRPRHRGAPATSRDRRTGVTPPTIAINMQPLKLSEAQMERNGIDLGSNP